MEPTNRIIGPTIDPVDDKRPLRERSAMELYAFATHHDPKVRSQWNKRRDEEPDFVPDFSSVGILVNPDFRNQNLRGAYFAGCVILGARFDRADLADASFAGAGIGPKEGQSVGACFAGATLTRVTFEGAELAFVDLSGATVPGHEGINAKNAVLKSVLAQASALKGSRFTGASLAEVDFSRALLVDAEFEAATLHRCKFDNADLRDTNFNSAVLTECTLIEAGLTEADLTDIAAEGNVFFGADLRQANLTRANLANAGLGNAQLGKATLSKANLLGTDLRGACPAHALVDDILTDRTTKLDPGQQRLLAAILCYERGFL